MTPRPPQQPSNSSARQTYIPPGVQSAMNQQMQRGLPAHLQQYVGANPSIIPQRAQAELTAHMQKVMPDHLKQYAGAYVEQNMMSRPATVSPTVGRPPMPDKLNQSHSGDVAAEQGNAQFLNLFQSDQQQPQAAPAQPGVQYPPQPVPTPPEPGSSYDFILNPAEPQKPKLMNFGGGSSMKRLATAAAGIVVLIILAVGLKGAFSGNSKPFSYPTMLSVVQSQQALLHISQNGTQNASSDTIKNFAATATVSLQSEESQLISYLGKNGYKVNPKQVNLKVSKTTDTQLATALSSSSFDSTFKQVMQDGLNGYKQTLQQAYSQTKGSKGRALLNADYDAIDLLLKQLGS